LIYYVDSNNNPNNNVVVIGPLLSIKDIGSGSTYTIVFFARNASGSLSTSVSLTDSGVGTNGIISKQHFVPISFSNAHSYTLAMEDYFGSIMNGSDTMMFYLNDPSHSNAQIYDVGNSNFFVVYDGFSGQTYNLSVSSYDAEFWAWSNLSITVTDSAPNPEFPKVSVPFGHSYLASNQMLNLSLPSYFSGSNLSYHMAANPHSNASLVDGQTLRVTDTHSGSSYSIVVAASNSRGCTSNYMYITDSIPGSLKFPLALKSNLLSSTNPNTTAWTLTSNVVFSAAASPTVSNVPLISLCNYAMNYGNSNYASSANFSFLSNLSPYIFDLSSNADGMLTWNPNADAFLSNAYVNGFPLSSNVYTNVFSGDLVVQYKNWGWNWAGVSPLTISIPYQLSVTCYPNVRWNGSTLSNPPTLTSVSETDSTALIDLDLLVTAGSLASGNSYSLQPVNDTYGTTPSFYMNGSVLTLGAMASNATYGSITMFTMNGIDATGNTSSSVLTLNYVYYMDPPTKVTSLGSVTLTSNQTVSYALGDCFSGTAVSYRLTANPQSNASIDYAGNLSVTDNSRGIFYRISVMASNAAGSVTDSLVVAGSVQPLSGLPYTTGLVGAYIGESYGINATNVWSDISGSGNDAMTSNVNATAGGLNGLDFVYGDPNSTVTWPTNFLTSTYTMFHLGRYSPSGGSKSRILASASGYNWLSGHWDGKSGVAYHDGWVTGSSEWTSVEGASGGDGTTWLLSTDQNDLYRANGITLGTGGGAGPPSVMAINQENENSDWQMAFMLVFDNYLSDTDYKAVEAWIASKYGIAVLTGSVSTIELTAITNEFSTVDLTTVVSNITSATLISNPYNNAVITGTSVDITIATMGVLDGSPTTSYNIVVKGTSDVGAVTFVTIPVTEHV
jgi:hypothetical protein